MNPATSMPGYPRGWFAVARSGEISCRQVQARHFMGHPIALFRTASGRVCATDAYCPHLGAHLGHCGAVVGESLQCGFHGFRFAGDGACLATGYRTRPPKAAGLRAWPVIERYGVILLYYDPAGAPPKWDLPQLDLSDWSPLIYHRFKFRGHPQEIAENTVDWGHFCSIHQFSEFGPLTEPQFENERMVFHNRAKRHIAPFGAELPIEFHVTVIGLGMSISDVTLPLGGMRLRQIYFATPVAPDRVELLAALSVHEPRRTTWAARGLQSLVSRTVARSMLAWIKSDLEKDIKIWQHKAYLERPALSEGDGPIGRYRRWVRQFYAAEATAVGESLSG